MAPMDDAHREEHLARAVRDGGESGADAEQSLCRLLGPRIHLYALRRLRSYADAADVMQEALALVVDALRKGKVEDLARISHFALGTSRHLVSRVRRGERARRGLQDAIDEPFNVCPGPEVWKLDMPALLNCLEKLAERDRRIIGMTFYDDHSSDEIATTVGLTNANVRVIRHRALVQLRSCVDGQHFGAK
jgi:RNA polymerase sigma-70 factor, ECF subfamily